MNHNINRMEASALFLHGRLNGLTGNQVLELARNSDFGGNCNKATICRLVAARVAAYDAETAELAAHQAKQADDNDHNSKTLSGLPSEILATLRAGVMGYGRGKRHNRRVCETARSAGFRVSGIDHLRRILGITEFEAFGLAD